MCGENQFVVDTIKCEEAAALSSLSATYNYVKFLSDMIQNLNC